MLKNGYKKLGKFYYKCSIKRAKLFSLFRTGVKISRNILSNESEIDFQNKTKVTLNKILELSIV